MATVLTGVRVVLTPPTHADAAEFLACVAASREHLEPWAYPPATDGEFAGYVARCAHGETHTGFLVREVTGRRLVGVVNVSEIVRGNFDSAYLGYYAFASAAGRGLMTEALGLVVHHAFYDLGLHRVEANIQPGNARSVALVRRLGFRYEGLSPRYLRIGSEWRDHERWALTREDVEEAGDVEDGVSAGVVDGGSGAGPEVDGPS